MPDFSSFDEEQNDIPQISIDWKKCIDETLNILEPLKIFPVIDKKYKAILALKQIDIIEQHIQKVQMFNLLTCKLMPHKDEQDLTHADCIPFHMMILLVMLMGLNKSPRIFLDTLGHWKTAKIIASKGIDDIQIMNKILISPVAKHARQAHAKYHQLLAYNLSSKGMCYGKAKRINGWMVNLQIQVQEAKTAYDNEQELSRLKALLCERDEKILEVDNKNARLTALLRKRDDSLRELSSALSGLNTAMCGYLGE